MSLLLTSDEKSYEIWVTHEGHIEERIYVKPDEPSEVVIPKGRFLTVWETSTR